MAQSKQERIAGVIREMATDYSGQWDVFSAWNDYAREHDPDGEVFGMESFDEFFCGSEPSDIAARIFYGDFCPAHEYFWLDGCANLESSDFLDESPLDPDALADYAVENDEDFGIDEVREILDEDDDEDEAA